MEYKPYTDKILKYASDYISYERIYHNLKTSNWYRDDKSRLIILLDGEAELEIQGKVPIKLETFKIFEILPRTYHRLKSKSNELLIKITEYL